MFQIKNILNMPKSIFPGFTFRKEKVGDCNSNGLLIYGCKHYLALCDITQEPYLIGIRRDIHDRVNCVTFNKLRPNILASSDCAGKLQIWICEYQNLESYINLQGFKNLTSLEWSHDRWDEIFISSDKCTITKFNISNYEKNEIVCGAESEKIAIISSNSNFLACGFENGIIALVELSKFQLHERLEAHNDFITNILWSPNADKFLSCSLDNTLKVWTVQEDCTKSVICYKWEQGMTSWPSAMWHPTKDDFIVLTVSGGLLGEIDSSLGENTKLDVYTHHARPGNKEISGLILNKANKNVVCAFSKDRMITMWNLDLKISFQENFTNISPAKSVAFSPVSLGLSHILAIVPHANHLLFWDTSSTASKCKTYTVYQNITSFVTCVAWHPEDRTALAFGTEEGSVAFLKNFMRSHKPNYYNLEHKGKVLNVCWGLCPKLRDPESPYDKTWAVFSCGEGFIHVHCFKRSANLAELVKFKYKKHFTCISWKDDYSLFAVGNGDSCFQVFDGVTYEILREIPVASSSIVYVVWHPCDYLKDKQLIPSSFHSWIAVLAGKNAKGLPPILLYDIEKKQEANDEMVVNVRESKSLVAYTSEMFSLSWNPHDERQLASCGNDHSVIIWDIVTGNPLLHYKGHAFTVTGVAFDPFDNDIVYSCSVDCSVRMWRKSDHYLMPQFKRVKAKPIEAGKKDLPSSGGEEMEDQDDASQACEDTSTNVVHKSTKVLFKGSRYLPNFVAFQFNNLSDDEKALEIQKFGEYVAERKNNKNLTRKLGENELSFLGWLGDKEDMERAIKSAELTEENLKHNVRYAAVWKNDLSEIAKHAIENESINDELMSVIPMNGRSAWKSLCAAYAKQLEKDGSYLKAAIYLYASRKTAECFNLVRDKIGAKVALCLAKLLFSHKDDPLIKTLTVEAMQEYVNEGNIGPLAKYFLDNGDFVSAAAAFGMKNNAKYDKTAAYMCFKSGNIENAEQHAMQCLKNGLSNCEWKIVKKMISEQPYMKAYMWVVNCHKSFINDVEILREKIVANPNQYGIQGKNSPDTSTSDSIIQWKCYDVQGKSYLYDLYHTLSDHIKLCLEEKSTEDIFSFLTLLLADNNQTNKSLEKVYLSIVISICKFFVTLSANSTDVLNSAFECLKSAFELCGDNEDLLNICCLMFFPFELYVNEDSSLKINILHSEEQNIIHDIHMTLKEYWEQKLVFVKNANVFNLVIKSFADDNPGTLTNENIEALLNVFISNFAKQSI